MKNSVTKSIKVAIILMMFPLFAMSIIGSKQVQAGPAAQEFDAAAMFKAKCAMCHGPKADKKFDATLPDAELVDFILKGKKGEKPPFMPEYATKGVTPENALALVTLMKQLKGTAAEAPK